MKVQDIAKIYSGKIVISTHNEAYYCSKKGPEWDCSECEYDETNCSYLSSYSSRDVWYRGLAEKIPIKWAENKIISMDVEENKSHRRDERGLFLRLEVSNER